MNGQQPQQPSLDDTPIKITITLPTQAYFISGIRDFTLEMVKNLTNFSEQWAFRFQSVIDELCNNAIEHGSTPGDDIRVIFNCQKGEFLEIFVEDTGTGKDKNSPQELERIVKDNQQADPTKIGSLRGRGLPHIIANWTDVLEFDKSEFGGTKVHVIKYLDQGAKKEAGPPKSSSGGGLNKSPQVFQL